MALNFSSVLHRQARKFIRHGIRTTRNRLRLDVQTLEDRSVPAGTVSGTVFQDYNGNGLYDVNPTIPNKGVGAVSVASDIPVQGVTVTVYVGNGTVVGSKATDAAGNYAIDTSAATGPFRVEFTGLPTGASYGPVGPVANAAVQFIPDGGSPSVNLAVMRAEDFSVTNPDLVTNVYVFGAFNGPNANIPSITSFGYNSGAEDLSTNQGLYKSPNTHELVVTHSQVGTTWGLGYNKVTNLLYASAFFKKHAGLGPGGAGAIYQITDNPSPAADSASVYVDLNAIFPGSVADPALNAFLATRALNGYDYVFDSGNTGWDAVGKVGLGGLDVDPAGQRIFTVGLADRLLYSIPTSGPLNASTIQRFQVPIPASVTGRGNPNDPNDYGDMRVFAVTYYRGRVYVGAVNTAESTTLGGTVQGDRSAMRAYVFAFDPAAGHFVDGAGNPSAIPVFDIALNYSRGIAHPGDNRATGATLDDESANWNPWTPAFRNIAVNQRGIYPQPWLTGIAFDNVGNLTLGLRDRAGDQFGRFTNDDPNTTVLYFGITAGDTLYAPGTPAAGWVLESNGSGSLGSGNGQGPGGGEFYYQDNLPRGATAPFYNDQPAYPRNGPNDHDEVSLGGVFHLPGTPDILTTVFDPARIANAYNTGGVRWFNAAAGNNVKGYELYLTDDGGQPQGTGQTTFAKSGGMGDLVAITLSPPIEIGDRAWQDTDQDGIQDPNEPAFEGLVLQLFGAGADGVFGTGDDPTTPIATVTTDANGNYLFSNLGKAADSTPNRAYGLALLPDTNYQVRFDLTQAALNNRILSPLTADGSANGTARDSNAFNGSGPLAGFGVVNAKTGSTGASDHTFDVGIIRGQTYNLGDFVWDDANNNGTFDTGETGLDGVTVQLEDGNSAIIATQVTAGGGKYLFTNLDPGTYSVHVVNKTLPAGYVSSTGKVNSPTGPFEPAAGGPGGNNTDHGTTNTAGTITQANGVTITNADILTQDFGFFRPLAIGNFVWNDLNNDGIFQPASESKLTQLTVDLLDSAGAVIATRTTDGNGNYLFDSLAEGKYQVRVTAPTGFVSSTGTSGSATGPFEPSTLTFGNNEQDHGTTTGAFVLGPVIDLADPAQRTDNGGTANLNQDFGLYRPLSIGNFVWEDANNNGKVDTGEKGLAGIAVNLRDSGGGLVASTTTNGQGGYLFTHLAPGQYRVEVVKSSLPAGYVTSTGTNGSVSGPFEPSPGTAGDNSDHGTDTGTVVQGTLIDLTTFDSQPTGETATPGGIADPATDSNANYQQDFGFYRPLFIGNRVWYDQNNSGTFDGGEKALENVTMELYSGGGAGGSGTLISTTKTDAAGLYQFTNLIPGTYVVRLGLPNADYASSTGKNGSATGSYEPGLTDFTDDADHGTNSGLFVTTAPVVLGAPGDTTANPDGDANGQGVGNNRQDFGLFLPLFLGNHVWIDANNNGKFDTGEAPVANLNVRLLDGGGATIASATTGADGKYLFGTLLPGQYRVELTAPAGLISSSGNPTGPTGPYEPAPLTTVDEEDKGTNSTDPQVPGSVIRSPIFTLGQPLDTATNPSLLGLGNLTIDFGLVPPPALGKLSGYVYIDPNINGVFEGTEKPIPTTKVQLTGTDAAGNPVPTQTVFTDSTGFYQFTDLPEGKYTVREFQPGGLLYDGLDTPGTVGSTPGGNDLLVVQLPNGGNSQNNNFGEIPPTSLFGYVYEDVNRNGFRDPGEPGIPGTRVTISGTAFAGSVLQRPLAAADIPGGFTVITDSDGRWEFILLPPGTFTMVETQPTGYSDFLESNLDPNQLPATTGNDVFSAVTGPSYFNRGPFNYGEVRTGSEPGKRDFLGSTGQNPPPPPIANLPLNPGFGVSSGTAANPTLVAVGAGAGRAPQVRIFDYTAGIEKFRFNAYEDSFTGGVRTAVGDVNGDGIDDVITGIGVGGGPRIRVFSGADASVLFDSFVYEPSFRGGLFVAAGDYNGDGKADIITGTDSGGGPRVRVLEAATGKTLADFFAFDSGQRGGVRVAAGDFNADGKADLVTTTGPGVPTRIRVFDAATGSTLADYTPYTPAFAGGVFIAVGDVDGNGTPDVIAGADVGGGPHVQVFSGLTTTSLASFFAYAPSFTGGVRVGAADVDGDGRDDIITSAGPGGNAHVRLLKSLTLAELDAFFAFDATFLGGAYVS